MKVTIWQQFSSNHSADFTIIGRFETAEQAQQAEATLRDMLQQIQDWIAKNPTKAAYHQQHWDTPTPIEKKLNAQYKIDWIPSLLEWLLFRYNDGRIHDVLGRYENLIFLGEGNTWSGGAPLHELLAKLGADILLQSEAFEKSIESTVVIIARTTQKAIGIRTALERDYSLHSEMFPWLVFVRTHDNLNIGVLQSALQKWLDYWRVRRAIGDRHQLGDIQTELITRMSQREWDDLVQRAHLQQSPNDPLVKRAGYLNGEMWLYYRNLVQDDNTITLQNCFFGEMATGFPAFIEWLKSQNCQVTYTFEEVSY